MTSETVLTRRTLNPDEVQTKHRCYQFFARARDIVVSFLVLLVLLVPSLILSLAIWLESPGASPIFRQTRIGKNGKPFKMFKFRSMCPNAEEKLADYLAANEADGPAFKIKNDPRITRIGKWIRATSIDELPQFFNVLRGDMSIVGPRPPLPREVAQYNDWQKQRLYVKPGITCFWQIRPHRNELLFDEWVSLDLDYIENRNFLLDLKIIFATVRAVFRRDGE